MLRTMLTPLSLSFNFSRLKTFQCLQQLNTHLQHNKFANTLVYFRASWNPQCEQADRQIQRFAANNAGYQVIKIDSDASPKIAKHYSVRAQPQFVFCLYGDQVIRQIGLDQAKLQDKVKKIEKLATQTNLSSVQNKWVPYGQKYRTYYQQVIRAQYKDQVSLL